MEWVVTPLVSLSDSLSSHTLNLASSLHTYCVATLTTCHYFSTTIFFLFLIANWHTHFPHLCHFQEMFFSFTCFTAICQNPFPQKKLHKVRVPGSSWPNEIQHKVHFLNSLEHNTKPVESVAVLATNLCVIINLVSALQCTHPTCHLDSPLTHSLINMSLSKLQVVK